MTWITVVVALISGLSGGLIGTVLNLHEDRKAAVRAETIEAVQAFAALATESFEAVGDAIENHEEESGPDKESRDEADRILKEARTRLDRLAVLVGPSSELVQIGARMNRTLASALQELPPSLPDINIALSDDEASSLDALSGDEHLEVYGGMQTDVFDEEIRKARLRHALALEEWRGFAEAASGILNRGLLPRFQRSGPVA